MPLKIEIVGTAEQGLPGQPQILTLSPNLSGHVTPRLTSEEGRTYLVVENDARNGNEKIFRRGVIRIGFAGGVPYTLNIPVSLVTN